MQFFCYFKCKQILSQQKKFKFANLWAVDFKVMSTFARSLSTYIWQSLLLKHILWCKNEVKLFQYMPFNSEVVLNSWKYTFWIFIKCVWKVVFYLHWFCFQKGIITSTTWTILYTSIRIMKMLSKMIKIGTLSHSFYKQENVPAAVSHNKINTS